MTTVNTIVQDIIADASDTQRAIIKSRLTVRAAKKAWNTVKTVAGLWATGDAHTAELEEAKEVYMDLEKKAKDAIGCLGSDMRPSAEVRTLLNLPSEEDLPNAECLGTLLKVALPGGGKMTDAVKAFLKG